MKLIPNFPKYSISIDGKTVIGPRGEMKIQLNNCGYRTIQIMNNQKGHTFSIARLMALTYIPNPENKPTIDHINRDRLDDRLENLQWATLLEQCENKSRYCNNTSGVKNIYINHSRKKKYVYAKQINGIEYKVSCFSLPVACFEQYCHSRITSLSTNS